MTATLALSLYVRMDFPILSRRKPMPKTTDIGDLPICRTSTVTAGCARLVLAAAKAGAAAILAVGLFGWSPYVPPAQAADIQVQTSTSASLVFSPMNVALSPPDTLNQWFVNLCATNYSSVHPYPVNAG
jgi:hypothetical protein